MKIEKINYLFELVINEKLLSNKITKHDLLKYNFSLDEINELLEKKYLITKNSYFVVNVEDLFIKGKKMFNKQKYDIAYLYFKNCYELDSTYVPANLYLFYYSISNGNYDKAFEHFELMENTDNSYYKTDNNFYLYMLNFITDVPVKYREKIKNMRLKDIVADLFDNRYSSVDSINKIRVAMYDKKFNYAISVFEELIKKENELVYNNLLEIFLNKASDKQMKDKNEILNFINLKQYDQIIEYLSNMEQTQNLTEEEMWVLKLTKQINEIKTTLEVPEKIEKQNKRFEEVIENKNYFLAFRLSYEYNKKNNICNETNIIYRLLLDLCNLIEDINVVNAKFSNLVSYLNNDDYKNAIAAIKFYLKKIDQEDKEELVINMVKLDIMMQDKTFKQTIHTLNNISDLNFDVNRMAKQVGKINSLSDTNSGKMFKFEEELQKKEEMIICNDLERQIESLHQKLLVNKGIVVLENITKEEYHKIYNIVNRYSDMVLFYVGSGKSRKYILRYRIRTEEKINYRKIIVLGLQAYRAKKYDSCIQYSLQLLQYGNPKASIYAMLGQCYLEKGNYDLAIMYLSVATEISKRDGLDYDFTEIINDLREKKITDSISNPKKLTLVNNRVVENE